VCVCVLLCVIDDEGKYNAMFEWKTRPLDEPVSTPYIFKRVCACVCVCVSVCVCECSRVCN
jgi:hypothetical protein